MWKKKFWKLYAYLQQEICDVILHQTCKFIVYFCKLTDMSRYVKNTGKGLLKNNKNLLQLGHNKVAGGPTRGGRRAQGCKDTKPTIESNTNRTTQTNSSIQVRGTPNTSTLDKSSPNAFSREYEYYLQWLFPGRVYTQKQKQKSQCITCFATLFTH